MNFDIIIEFLPKFFDGLYVTLWIVCISLITGSALSLPLALVRVYNVPILGTFSRIYSYVLRGTPLLVQIYLLYYGLSQFEAVRESWVWFFLKDAGVCLLVGFTLNLAAYVSEIVRGALMSIPRGEIEAARAYGMSELKVIRHVTLPGALRRTIPPLSNQVIFLVHSSAIASAITVIDILGVGRELNATYYVSLEGFVAAAAFYVVVIMAITVVFRFLEKRYAGFLL
ncbi:MAG: ABC transporter permease [Pelagimonas sp.]|uniref:ABC transporter permease n=1 Tax=Pelagimonas sp. TaxID=2073170 RepID=UPI003D6C1D05